MNASAGHDEGDLWLELSAYNFSLTLMDIWALLEVESRTFRWRRLLEGKCRPTSGIYCRCETSIGAALLSGQALGSRWSSKNLVRNVI